MMSDPRNRNDESAEPEGRPFPWFCPNCRRKEVRRQTIPYRCELLDNGQPVSVFVPDLAVPKCGNCGELVFDYLADEQLNQAFLAKTRVSAASSQNAAPAIDLTKATTNQ
jgi:hypothetical protein